MTDTGWTGGCQCGAVRFRVGVIADPSFCHCRTCQKAFAGPGAALVDVEGLVWTRGAPKYFQSSNKVRRGFCADCGTQLTFEVAEGPSIAIAAFDRAHEIVPVLQVNLDRRLPWADHIADLPKRTPEQIAARAAHYAAIVSYQHPDHDTEAWPRAGAASEPLTDWSFALRADQKEALGRYHRSVRNHYGTRLFDVVLVGRRRLVDDIDVDLEVSLAVILADGVWNQSEEMRWLAGAAFETLVEAGINIRARSISVTDWTNPDIDAVSHDVRRVRSETATTAQRMLHVRPSDLDAFIGRDEKTP